jgi:hypothetical protein
VQGNTGADAAELLRQLEAQVLGLRRSTPSATVDVPHPATSDAAVELTRLDAIVREMRAGMAKLQARRSPAARKRHARHMTALLVSHDRLCARDRARLAAVVEAQAIRAAVPMPEPAPTLDDDRVIVAVADRVVLDLTSAPAAPPRRRAHLIAA